MKFELFLVLTLLLSCMSFITRGDIWFQTYKLNQTKAAINIFTRGRFGFTYMKFSSPKMQNLTIVLFVQNNAIQVIESSTQDLDLPLMEKDITISLLSEQKIKSFGNAFNDIELTVAFPIDYLENNTFLTVGKFENLTSRIQ